MSSLDYGLWNLVAVEVVAPVGWRELEGLRLNGRDVNSLFPCRLPDGYESVIRVLPVQAVEYFVTEVAYTLGRVPLDRLMDARRVSDFVRVLADYGVGFDYGRFAQDYFSLLSGGALRDAVVSQWSEDFAHGKRAGSDHRMGGFAVAFARENRERYDTVSELVSRGEAMRFAGVAYALGLVSPVDYENFLDECQYADKDEVVCLDASMRREIMKYVDDPKQEKKLRKRRERAGDQWEYPMDFYKWDDPRSRKFR